MLSPRSPFVTRKQGARALMPVPISSDEDNMVDGLAYAEVFAMAETPRVPLGYVRHDTWDGVWRPVPPDGATSALVRVEGGTVRWRDDSVEPTDTQGMPLYDGEPMTYDLTTQTLWFHAVEPGAILHVAFYGYPSEDEG